MLDQIPATPQRRAAWPVRRFPILSTYARIGLVAAAVILAVAVGIGLLGRPSEVGPLASATPSPSSSLSPSGIGPSPIDGTYQTSFSLADLTASPLVTANEIKDGNWGSWQLRFRMDRFSYTQQNNIANSSSQGSFTIDGDAITLAVDKGVHVGETFAFRWQRNATELTFSRDDTLGIGPTPFLVKPWLRLDAIALAGTWLGAEVTCAQQIATVEAAGFTAEQMTASGLDPTCANGGTNQYGLGFLADGTLAVTDRGAITHPAIYRLIDTQSFESGQPDGFACLTYGYAIDGDQLTIEILDFGCAATGPATLGDQMHLTAIFETSPFTRQP
ncbi:MAG TPA: hypothetical protein VL687_08125 [Methylomirabilota bacterium]|nr:hypothetical protein [Methylomirabilota bacterium]